MWWDIRKFTTPVEKLVLDPKLKEEDGPTDHVKLCKVRDYFIPEIISRPKEQPV